MAGPRALKRPAAAGPETQKMPKREAAVAGLKARKKSWREAAIAGSGAAASLDTLKLLPAPTMTTALQVSARYLGEPEPRKRRVLGVWF